MFKNVKKEDIVTVLTELGEAVNMDMKMIELKQKLLTHKEYLKDEQFVKDYLISTVENRKQEEENRKQEEENRKQEEENRKQEEERRLEREHELEMARIRGTQNGENRSPLPGVNSNGDNDVSLDKLIKGVEILTIPVPRRAESWNLFFDSLERAYKHKKVPEEFQAEILLKLLGDKASNILVYIKEEDLKDYAKVKALVLKEFEPTAQACLDNFRKAKRNSGETHIQFASRLTSTWEYYCKLRKVEDLESLKDLIISDRLFQALDCDTASHICLRQGENWLRPQELAKECDIYFGAKQKSFEEPRNEEKRTFAPGKYVPPHLRKEISRKDNGFPKRKECFVCGSLLHLARECPDKCKRNEFVPKQNDKNIYKNSNENRSANQEALVAKVLSSHLQPETVQNLVTPLKKINICIDSKEIEAIIDSGTQISVIHSSLVPDLQKEEGSKILLTPAFGGQIEAKICRIPIYYKNSGSNIFNSVDTLIAVTDKINVPCLITPGIYELLVNPLEYNWRIVGDVKSSGEGVLTLHSEMKQKETEYPPLQQDTGKEGKSEQPMKERRNDDDIDTLTGMESGDVIKMRVESIANKIQKLDILKESNENVNNVFNSSESHIPQNENWKIKETVEKLVGVNNDIELDTGKENIALTNGKKDYLEYEKRQTFGEDVELTNEKENVKVDENLLKENGSNHSGEKGFDDVKRVEYEKKGKVVSIVHGSDSKISTSSTEKSSSSYSVSKIGIHIEDQNSAETFRIPNDALVAKIVRQAESYFSDFKLLKNNFLLKHVRRNEEGYVSLKLVASFRKIKSLTKDWRVVAHSLQSSKLLELNSDKSKIRRIEPIPKVEEISLGKIVVVFNLPFQNPTSDELKEMFSKFGNIVHAEIMSPKSENHNTYYKRCRYQNEEIASTIFET